MTQVKDNRRIFHNELRDSKYLLIAFMMAILILSLPFAFNLLPSTHSTSTAFKQTANNEGVKIKAAEHLCGALSKGDEINIRLTGNIIEFYNYQNLFQTSDFNAGIRLEINDSGQGGLLIGSSAADGFSSVSIPEKFELGNFDISIRINDGQKVSLSFLDRKIVKVVSGLKPKCDNVVVGYGFDSSRVVRGEVEFLASASNSDPRFVPRWLDDGVRIDWFRALITAVFYFTLISVAFKLATETEEKSESAGEEQDRT
jgi:ABC-type sugar transport system permease subunit